MFNKNKKIQIFIAFWLIMIVMLANLNIVQAFYTIPTSSSISSEMERRYNIDLETVRDYSQGINLTNRKGDFPQVLLFFNNSDPKEGEKIKAIAQPLFFSAQKEDLYFTWYIKRKGGGDNVEDWKKEAAKIIVNNGFDVRKANYSGGGDDPDKDGYKARYGGHSAVKDSYSNPADNKWCYIHDFESGKNYELTHDDLSDAQPQCGGSKIPVCFQNRKGIQITDFLDNFNEGELLGYIIGNNVYSGRTYDDPNNPMEVDQCLLTSERPVCWGENAYCYLSGSENGDDTGRGFPRCASEGQLNQGVFDTDEKCQDSDEFAALQTPSCNDIDSVKDSCVKRHLFPSPGNSGDGEFTNAEEEKWRTNPYDPNTANRGEGDEANLVGLGISEFEWNYRAGDLVGVVVEGTSMISTKHKDDSSMIMWALPNNKCTVSDKGSYTKRIKGQQSTDGTGHYFVEIETASVDINDCLKNNLIDPREGGQSGNLEVELDYNPKELRNDPYDANIDVATNGVPKYNQNLGDNVLVQAFVSNASKTQDNICYEWWVQINPDYDTDWDNWETICCPETSSCLPSLPAKNMSDEEIGCNTKCEFNDITPLVGNNLSELKFKLNLDEKWFNDDGETFLRVNSRAVEHYEYSSDLYGNPDNNTREGQSDVIIKVNTTKDTIDAFDVDVTVDNVTGKPTNLSLGGSICDCADPTSDSCDQYGLQECWVAPNEIIGVSVEDLGLTQHSWTLNNKPLYCDSSISSFCGESKTAVNFFPVTGFPGDVLVLKYAGMNPKTGKSVSLERRFKLVQPKVRIVPVGDGARKKLLGKFKALDFECTNNCEDYSDKLLETDPGNTVELRAQFIPSFIERHIKGRWTLDTETADEFIEGGISNLVFEVNKDFYDSYLVGFDGLYNQRDEIRRALYYIWGIKMNKTTETVLNRDILVNVTDNTMVAKNEQKGFIASVAFNTGEQLMFMLKISLLAFVLLIVMNFIHMLTNTVRRDNFKIRN